MVFINRIIPSVQDIEINDSKIYQYAPPLSMKKEQVLQDGNQNALVGMLTQLSFLANYANDIFTDLVVVTTKNFERIIVIKSKLQAIQEAAPALEDYHKNNKSDVIFSNPRQEFSLPVIGDAQLFTQNDCSNAIRNLYAKANKPPRLDLMDKFMDDGKKCLSLYTNPSFFLDEWIVEQHKLRQAAKEERKKRREERRLKKEEESVKGTKVVTKKVTKLQKVVYDPHTGQKKIITIDSDDTSRPAVQSTLNLSGEVRSAGAQVPSKKFQTESVDNREVPPNNFDEKQNVNNFVTPIPISNVGQSSNVTPPPSDFPLPPSDIPLPLSDFPLPPSDIPLPPSDIPLPPSDIPLPPSEIPFPPSDIPTISDSVPQFNEDTNNPLTNTLLAAIANKGTSLKPVQAPVKKVDAHSDLLTQIKFGKALKKVEAEAVAKKPPPPSNSVAGILSRRIAIVGSDDDESDDEDDDWD